MDNIKKAAGKPPKFSNYIEDKYLVDRHKYTPMVVYPTRINFSGTDIENPVVCSQFGCKVKLSRTERLFGTTCIHHQRKVKIDVSKFIQHPHKQTA